MKCICTIDQVYTEFAHNAVSQLEEMRKDNSENGKSRINTNENDLASIPALRMIVDIQENGISKYKRALQIKKNGDWNTIIKQQEEDWQQFLHKYWKTKNPKFGDTDDIKVDSPVEFQFKPNVDQKLPQFAHFLQHWLMQCRKSPKKLMDTNIDGDNVSVYHKVVYFLQAILEIHRNTDTSRITISDCCNIETIIDFGFEWSLKYENKPLIDALLVLQSVLNQFYIKKIKIAASSNDMSDIHENAMYAAFSNDDRYWFEHTFWNRQLRKQLIERLNEKRYDEIFDLIEAIRCWNLNDIDIRNSQIMDKHLAINKNEFLSLKDILFNLCIKVQSRISNPDTTILDSQLKQLIASVSELILFTLSNFNFTGVESELYMLNDLCQIIISEYFDRIHSHIHQTVSKSNIHQVKMDWKLIQKKLMNIWSKCKLNDKRYILQTVSNMYQNIIEGIGLKFSLMYDIMIEDIISSNSHCNDLFSNAIKNGKLFLFNTVSINFFENIVKYKDIVVQLIAYYHSINEKENSNDSENIIEAVKIHAINYFTLQYTLNKEEQTTLSRLSVDFMIEIFEKKYFEILLLPKETNNRAVSILSNEKLFDDDTLFSKLLNDQERNIRDQIINLVQLCKNQKIITTKDVDRDVRRMMNAEPILYWNDALLQLQMNTITSLLNNNNSNNTRIDKTMLRKSFYIAQQIEQSGQDMTCKYHIDLWLSIISILAESIHFQTKDINNVLNFLDDFDDLRDVWYILDTPFDFLFGRAFINLKLLFGNEYNIVLDNQMRLLQEHLRPRFNNDNTSLEEFIILFGSKVVEFKQDVSNGMRYKHSKKFDRNEMCLLIDQIMQNEIYLNTNLKFQDILGSVSLTSWCAEIEKYKIKQKVHQIALLCRSNGKMSKRANYDEQVNKLLSYVLEMRDKRGNEMVTMLLDRINIDVNGGTHCNWKCILELCKYVSSDCIGASWNQEFVNQLKKTQIQDWKNMIEKYNENRTGHILTIEELLESMSSKDKIGQNGIHCGIKHELENKSILNCVKNIFDYYHRHTKKWRKSDIKRWVRKHKDNYNVKNGAISKRWYHYDSKVLITLMAVILRVFEIVKGYVPRDIQIICALLFLNLNYSNKGRVGNIGTGEGKSTIIVMFSICQVFVANKKIDIVTSSKVLAIRDASDTVDGYSSIYDYFDIKVSNNCDERCDDGQNGEKERKQRYIENDIIYGETGYFQRDILLQSFFDKEIRNTADKVGDILILDECDNMLIDSANKVLYISHSIDDLRYIKDLFLYIWCAVNGRKESEYNQENIEKIKDYILELIEHQQLNIPQNLMAFINCNLESWIRNAYYAKFIDKNDSYIIDTDTKNENKSWRTQIGNVLIMDKDTGVEQPSTQWSHGLHQFIQLKHSSKLTNESLKAVFISNLNYFQRYQTIIGMTGSLGGKKEIEFLSNNYDIDCFDAPRFKLSQFVYQNHCEYVCCDKMQWLSKIVKEIKNKTSVAHKKQRAVLVICENIQTVDILCHECQNNFDKSHIFRYDRFSNKLKLKRNELQVGDIIIATNIAGRGTNIKLSQKLTKNGGLHVILSYMPRNYRIELQGFGRCARNGEPGTGTYIVYDNSSYDETIDHLKRKRNEIENQRLNELQTQLLPKVQLEDDIFDKFETFKHLFDDKIEDILNSNKNVFTNELEAMKHDFAELQLKSLQNRWAFWLNKQTVEQLNNDNITYSDMLKDTIIENFDQFKNDILNSNQLTKLNGNIFGIVDEPSQLIKLGLMYYHFVNEDAHFANKQTNTKLINCSLKCFDHVINQYYPATCVGIACYYKVMVLLHEYGASKYIGLLADVPENVKVPKFLKHLEEFEFSRYWYCVPKNLKVECDSLLQTSLKLLVHERNTVLQRNEIMKTVNKLTQAQGHGISVNYFEIQNENIARLLSYHINAIQSIIGTGINCQMFTSVNNVVATEVETDDLHIALYDEMCKSKHKIIKDCSISDDVTILSQVLVSENEFKTFIHKLQSSNKIKANQCRYDPFKNVKMNENNCNLLIRCENKQFRTILENEKQIGKRAFYRNDKYDITSTKKILYNLVDCKIPLKYSQFTDEIMDYLDNSIVSNDHSISETAFTSIFKSIDKECILDECQNVIDDKLCTVRVLSTVDELIGTLDEKSCYGEENASKIKQFLKNGIAIDMILRNGDLVEKQALLASCKDIDQLDQTLNVPVYVGHNEKEYLIICDELLTSLNISKLETRRFKLKSENVILSVNSFVQVVIQLCDSQVSAKQSKLILDYLESTCNYIAISNKNDYCIKSKCMSLIKHYLKHIIVDLDDMDDLDDIKTNNDIINHVRKMQQKLNQINLKQLGFDKNQCTFIRGRIKGALSQLKPNKNPNGGRELIQLSQNEFDTLTNDEFAMLRAYLQDCGIINVSLLDFLSVSGIEIGHILHDNTSNRVVSDLIIKLFFHGGFGSNVSDNSNINIFQSSKDHSCCLWNYLFANQIIVPAKVDIGYTNDNNEKKINEIEETINNILCKLDFTCLKKRNDLAYEVCKYIPIASIFAKSRNQLLKDCTQHVMQIIKQSIGMLKQVSTIELKCQNLLKALNDNKDNIPLDEIEDFISYSFDQIVSIKSWKHWFDWKAFAIAIGGIAEIALGAWLGLLTFGSSSFISAALINEGIGDLIFAAQSVINRSPITRESYLIHKAQSVCISVLTAGVASGLTSATKVGKAAKAATAAKATKAAKAAKAAKVGGIDGIELASTWGVISAVGEETLAHCGTAATQLLVDIVSDKVTKEIGEAIVSQFLTAFARKIQDTECTKIKKLMNEIYLMNEKNVESADGVINNAIESSFREFQNGLIRDQTLQQIISISRAVGSGYKQAANSFRQVEERISINQKIKNPTWKALATTAKTIRDVTTYANITHSIIRLCLVYNDFKAILEKKLTKIKNNMANKYQQSGRLANDDAMYNTDMDNNTSINNHFKNISSMLLQFMTDLITQQLNSLAINQLFTMATEPIRDSVGKIIKHARKKLIKHIDKRGDKFIEYNAVGQNSEDKSKAHGGFRLTKKKHKALKKIGKAIRGGDIQDKTILNTIIGIDKSGNPMTIKEYIAIHGDDTLIAFNKKTGCVCVIAPLYSEYVNSVGNGQYAGSMQFEVESHMSGCIIDVVDAKGKQIREVVSKRVQENRSSKHRTIMFDHEDSDNDDSNHIKHISPCVKNENTGEMESVNIKQPSEFLKGKCFAQTCLFFEKYDTAMANNIDENGNKIRTQSEIINEIKTYLESGSVETRKEIKNFYKQCAKVLKTQKEFHNFYKNGGTLQNMDLIGGMATMNKRNEAPMSKRDDGRNRPEMTKGAERKAGNHEFLLSRLWTKGKVKEMNRLLREAGVDSKDSYGNEMDFSDVFSFLRITTESILYVSEGKIVGGHANALKDQGGKDWTGTMNAAFHKKLQTTIETAINGQQIVTPKDLCVKLIDMHLQQCANYIHKRAPFAFGNTKKGKKRNISKLQNTAGKNILNHPKSATEQVSAAREQYFQKIHADLYNLETLKLIMLDGTNYNHRIKNSKRTIELSYLQRKYQKECMVRERNAKQKATSFKECANILLGHPTPYF